MYYKPHKIPPDPALDWGMTADERRIYNAKRRRLRKEAEEKKKKGEKDERPN